MRGPNGLVGNLGPTGRDGEKGDIGNRGRPGEPGSPGAKGIMVWNKNPVWYCVKYGCLARANMYGSLGLYIVPLAVYSCVFRPLSHMTLRDIRFHLLWLHCTDIRRTFNRSYYKSMRLKSYFQF